MGQNLDLTSASAMTTHTDVTATTPGRRRPLQQQQPNAFREAVAAARLDSGLDAPCRRVFLRASSATNRSLLGLKDDPPHLCVRSTRLLRAAQIQHLSRPPARCVSSSPPERQAQMPQRRGANPRLLAVPTAWSCRQGQQIGPSSWSSFR